MVARTLFSLLLSVLLFATSAWAQGRGHSFQGRGAFGWSHMGAPRTFQPGPPAMHFFPHQPFHFAPGGQHFPHDGNFFFFPPQGPLLAQGSGIFLFPPHRPDLPGGQSFFFPSARDFLFFSSFFFPHNQFFFPPTFFNPFSSPFFSSPFGWPGGFGGFQPPFTFGSNFGPYSGYYPSPYGYRPPYAPPPEEKRPETGQPPKPAEPPPPLNPKGESSIPQPLAPRNALIFVDGEEQTSRSAGGPLVLGSGNHTLRITARRGEH